MIVNIVLLLSLFLINFLILKNSNKIGNIFNLIDYPLFERSIHSKPVPKIGGLVILLNILIIIFFLILNNHSSFDLNLLILSSSIVFFLIGYFDDIKNPSPLKKFVIILIGLFILSFINKNIFLNFLYFGTFNKTFYLGNLSYFFTFFCIYLLLNAFNMIDGINGLALSIFTIWLIFLTIYSDNFSTKFLTYLLPFIGIVLVFNLQNKIFIGNSGSYLLGGLISLLTVYLYNLEYRDNTIIKKIYVENIFLLFLVPGLDCARLFFQRIFILKKNFYNADNNHFHHFLIKKYDLSKSLFIYLSIIIFPNILGFLFKEYILLVIFFNILTYFIFTFRYLVANK